MLPRRRAASNFERQHPTRSLRQPFDVCLLLFSIHLILPSASSVSPSFIAHRVASSLPTEHGTSFASPVLSTRGVATGPSASNFSKAPLPLKRTPLVRPRAHQLFSSTDYQPSATDTGIVQSLFAGPRPLSSSGLSLSACLSAARALVCPTQRWWKLEELPRELRKKGGNDTRAGMLFI